MTVVGLLGGLAAGKSRVARQFARLGAAVLDGDQLGHEVLREPAVMLAARERWGGGVFTSEGHLDRRALAARVFGPSRAHELAYLEQVTHPRIKQRLVEHKAALAASGRRLAVLDAAVMLKAGWDGLCDIIVFVDAPREIRIARSQARGWSDQEFAEREAAQETLERKRQHADVVIDNSGSPEATWAQVVRLWSRLIPAPP
jgi:dephospho-CoA kinase